MNIIDNDVPLPLQLLNFEGHQQDRNIRLKWNTADERNTDHFKILHSNDGSRFESIGQVQAIGAGNNHYTFTDLQPQHSNYYRLHMVDKDGQAVYSNIIMR